jgi:hypothetical protein
MPMLGAHVCVLHHRSARLRLDRSRVARGGQTLSASSCSCSSAASSWSISCKFAVEPASQLVSLAAGEGSSRCGLRGTPSSSSWPRLCPVRGSTYFSAASSSSFCSSPSPHLFFATHSGCTSCEGSYPKLPSRFARGAAVRRSPPWLLLPSPSAAKSTAAPNAAA